MAFPPEMPVVVGAIALKDNEILLVRQTYGLFKGMWSLPSGFVDEGEHPDAAVLRELREEAHVEAEVLGLHSVTTFVENNIPCVYLVFLCKHVNGTPNPDGNENDGATYFSEQALRETQEPVEAISRLFAERYWRNEYKVMHPTPVQNLHPIYTLAFL